MQPKRFGPGAIEALQHMDWTGNIRELHNVVERLAILSHEQITERDVELYAHPGLKPTHTDGLPLDKFNNLKEFLQWAEAKWKEAH